MRFDALGRRLLGPTTALALMVGGGVRTPPSGREPLLASLVPDTGDFAVGPRSYADMTTPLWCVVAAQRVRAVLQGSVEAQASLDTLLFLPERDTLPAGVAAVARACGAKFTVAGTPAVALRDLVRLDLLAGEDSLAQAAITRLLALAPTTAQRVQLQLWAIGTYVRATPARVAAAEALITHLDTYDSTAILARMLARDTMLMVMKSQWLSLDGTAAERLQWRREATRTMTLATQLRLEELTANQGDVWYGGGRLLYTASHNLMMLAALWVPDSLEAWARQIQQVYHHPAIQHYLQAVQQGEVPGIDTRERGLDMDLPPAIDTMPLSYIFARFAPRILATARYMGQRPLPRPGQHTPRVPAAFWFPAMDSVQPVPGQISLLVYDPGLASCLHTLSDGILNGRKDCEQFSVNQMRDFLRRFGHAGLRITIVADVNADSESVLMSGPARPDSAARTFARYVQDVLNLPVTVALDTVSQSLRVEPDVDGRLYYDAATTLTKQYLPANEYTNNDFQDNIGFAALTGRDGVMTYFEVGRNGSAIEEGWFFDVMIAQALQLQRPEPSAPRSATLAQPSPARHAQ